MPLCLGNSRYPAVETAERGLRVSQQSARGDRRSIAGHTNHCRNTRGIDDTSTILLLLVPSPRLVRGAHASVRHDSLPLSHTKLVLETTGAR